MECLYLPGDPLKSWDLRPGLKHFVVNHPRPRSLRENPLFVRNVCLTTGFLLYSVRVNTQGGKTSISGCVHTYD